MTRVTLTISLAASLALGLLSLGCNTPAAEEAPAPERTGGSSGAASGGRTGSVGTGGSAAPSGTGGASSGGSPGTGGSTGTGGASSGGSTGTGGSASSSGGSSGSGGSSSAGTGGATADASTTGDTSTADTPAAGDAGANGPGPGVVPLAGKPSVYICPKDATHEQCCQMLCECVGRICADSAKAKPGQANCMPTCMKLSDTLMRCHVYHCYESVSPSGAKDHDSHCGHAANQVNGGGCPAGVAN